MTKGRSISSFLSLFCSFGTLICCALPALLVTLGLGATLAGLVSTFPQLVWLSEHKTAVFIISGTLLTLAAYMQYRARNMECPVDDLSAQETCASARHWSIYILGLSFLIYVVGGYFAFIAPLLGE